MSDEVKNYSNEDIIVSWDAKKCKHAAECVKNAPNVFQPKERPWIKMEGGDTGYITNAIDQCPSGALSYERK
ncbi:MAG: (4Fe-4S)-binding protein [Crocinitomicaceae bacterium]